uniref:Methyltransferase type 11 domain-containing protein n=2 Tax=Graphocephala atropunctata TaxID=36148 RepID=A0A1B6L1X8_9HEMI
MAYIRNPLQAVSYNRFRPLPPKDIIEKTVCFLKEGIRSEHLEQALDVGCGSGQSTEILAPYFEQVIGLDNSEEQLSQARKTTKYQNVSYRSGSAEKLEMADGSVDLVTVGMAIHWFDLQQFSMEVGRVLRSQGVLAVYGYNLPRPSVGSISLADTVQSMFTKTLGNYMPAESRLAYIDGYKRPQFSKFPFSSHPALRFESQSTTQKASIEDLVGYISTTSSYQNYLAKHGDAKATGLLADFKSRVLEQLGGGATLESQTLDITFPYFLLLSRKDV